MEQLYLIEIYVKSLCLRCPPGGSIPAEEKKLTVGVGFGDVASLTIHENEFENDILQNDISDDEMEDPKDDTRGVKDVRCCRIKGSDSKKSLIDDEAIDYTEKTITERVFKSGVSLLFAHNPIGLVETFKLFPLDVSVWTDDETEARACVGTTRMLWNTKFLEMVAEASDPTSTKGQKPLILQTQESLRCERSGSVIGDICLFVRLTTFGCRIVTRFSKAEDVDGFIFRSLDANSSMICSKYGLNTKPEQLASYGQVDDTGIDGRIDYVNMLVGKPHKIFGSACDNKAYQLTEMPPTGDGVKNTEDCCCNCKYINIPIEKDTLPKFSDEQKQTICEVCGGISYDGNTCKAKAQCSAPCNGDRVNKDQHSDIQRMLYEGLKKILSSERNGNHKKFCPDFKHKPSCPAGGGCIR